MSRNKHARRMEAWGAVAAIVLQSLIASAAPRTVATHHVEPSERIDAISQITNYIYINELINESKVDREMVGGIFKSTAGCLSYSVGAGGLRTDKVRFRIPRAPGRTLVALWHTHGLPRAGRDRFSRHDVLAVKATGLPMLLLDGSGSARLLRQDTVRASPWLRSSPGEPVPTDSSTPGCRPSRGEAF